MRKIEQFGDITTILGDCMDYMATLPDNYFSLGLVDPPYAYNTENTGILNFRMKAQEKNWNTYPDKQYFIELKRVTKNQIIWGGNYFPELWINGCRGFIFWYKQNPVSNFADGELAWTSFDENASCFDYRYYGNLQGNSNADSKIDPTQKPVALYKWLLHNYAKEGDTIFDSHFGSLSIGIACHDMGFKLTACELDEDYYKAATKRLQAHQQQQKLF